MHTFLRQESMSPAGARPGTGGSRKRRFDKIQFLFSPHPPPGTPAPIMRPAALLVLLFVSCLFLLAEPLPLGVVVLAVPALPYCC